tara:strand:+ start:33801 stop:33992 length:192 start_codon:yes stop_codon:yes gene_type:complete
MAGQSEASAQIAAARLIYDNIKALKEAYRKKDITKEQYDLWMGRYNSQLEDILAKHKEAAQNG